MSDASSDASMDRSTGWRSWLQRIEAIARDALPRNETDDGHWFNPWVTAAFCGAVAVFLWRAGYSLTTPLPFLIYEDGDIFFHDAFEQAFPGSIVRYYAGYLHVVPRLIAEAATLLPVGCTAQIYFWSALVLNSLAFSFVASRRLRHLVRSDALRCGLAIMFCVLPNDTTFTLITYIQWHFLIFLALLTMAEAPRSGRFMGVEATGAALAIFSTPAAMALLPLIAIRTWIANSRRERIYWLVLMGVLLAYAGTVALAREPAAPTLASAHSFGERAQTLVRLFALQLLAPFFLGADLTKSLGPDIGWNRTLVLCAQLALLAGALIVHFVPKGERARLLAPAYLIAALSVLPILRPGFIERFRGVEWVGGDRYYLGQTLLLAVLAAMTVERILQHRPPLLRAVVALWAAAFLAMHAGTAAFTALCREPWPEWRSVAQTITEAQNAADRDRHSVTVTLRTGGWPPYPIHFELTVPPRKVPP